MVKKSTSELKSMLQEAETKYGEFSTSHEALNKVWYEKNQRKFFLEFNSGVQVGIPVDMEAELKGKSDEELEQMTVDFLRETVIWENLDVYLYALGTVFKALNGPEFEKCYQNKLLKSKTTGKSKKTNSSVPKKRRIA